MPCPQDLPEERKEALAGQDIGARLQSCSASVARLQGSYRSASTKEKLDRWMLEAATVLTECAACVERLRLFDESVSLEAERYARSRRTEVTRLKRDAEKTWAEAATSLHGALPPPLTLEFGRLAKEGPPGLGRLLAAPARVPADRKEVLVWAQGSTAGARGAEVAHALHDTYKWSLEKSLAFLASNAEAPAVTMRIAQKAVEAADRPEDTSTETLK